MEGERRSDGSSMLQAQVFLSNDEVERVKGKTGLNF
jgi:hypothetical protein